MIRIIFSLLIFVSPLVIAQGPPRAAPVRVAVVELRELAPAIWVPGNVLSRQQANVAAEVAGRLTSVAEVGERVSKGAVLARLDDSETRFDVQELKADLKRVQARYTFLKREVDRLERLAKQNNAAKTQLDQTVAERDALFAEKAVITARIEKARLKLKRTAVRAPFSGVVVERILQKGEWVDDGEAVVKLVNTNELEIQAKVPMSIMESLKDGDTLAFKDGKRIGTSKVRTVVPVGDAQSRLAEIRAVVESGDWAPGQAVRISVPTAAARKVRAVPRDSLVLRRTGATVFRVNGENKAERVEVTTGIASGKWIEVKGALKVGDKVITRGNERLRPGQSVNVVGEAG